MSTPAAGRPYYEHVFGVIRGGFLHLSASDNFRLHYTRTVLLHEPYGSREALFILPAEMGASLRAARLRTTWSAALTLEVSTPQALSVRGRAHGHHWEYQELYAAQDQPGIELTAHRLLDRLTFALHDTRDNPHMAPVLQRMTPRYVTEATTTGSSRGRRSLSRSGRG